MLYIVFNGRSEVDYMRLATTARGTETDFEKRRLQLARREMDQSYKKNAKYIDPTKNPMLRVLEDLLSGKTEKELNEGNSAEKQKYEKLKQQFYEQTYEAADTNVSNASTYTYVTESNDQNYVIGDEAAIETSPIDSLSETIEVLKKVNQAALVSPTSSPQDLHTIFGKDLEKLNLNRIFNKAKSVYTTHVDMVNNGYRPYNEPLFTRTA